MKVANVIQVSPELNAMNVTVSCTEGSCVCVEIYIDIFLFYVVQAPGSSIIKLCFILKLCLRPLPCDRLIMFYAFCSQCNSTEANFSCRACTVCTLFDNLVLVV